MNRRKFLVNLGVGVVGFGGLAGFAVAKEYAHSPRWKLFEEGRLKNNLALIVSGIVAREMYGNNNTRINLQVKRFLWPNSAIYGETSENNIYTYSDSNSSNYFKLERKNIEDTTLWKGKVNDMSDDLTVIEQDHGIYEIYPPNNDPESVLSIDLTRGIISGDYKRPDKIININGTYDREHVKIELTGRTSGIMILEGRITDKIYYV
ncbi:MAG TPA: hypothetical protein VEC16_05335 [Alphaproteobacteria bacterium]|nr:hypothetical protein [Alphaproteobacteria bacterium]